MKTQKTIITVWNHRELLLNCIRVAIISSYKNGTELPEEISDTFVYQVFETESDVRLIVDFV